VNHLHTKRGQEEGIRGVWPFLAGDLSSDVGGGKEGPSENQRPAGNWDTHWDTAFRKERGKCGGLRNSTPQFPPKKKARARGKNPHNGNCGVQKGEKERE